MNPRSWLMGGLSALVAGLLVAIPFTVSDWRLNPSGLFHDDQGTNWEIVMDTALSWFWPVALVVLIATIVIHAIVIRFRRH